MQTKMSFLLFFIFDYVLKPELVAQGFSWIIIMLDMVIGKLQRVGRGEFVHVHLFLGFF